MKNKIISLLLTVLSMSSFAQTKVAQKQIANLQDSLNVRQVYADTNTTDATRSWVLGQIAADTPTINEVLAAGNEATGNKSIILKDGSTDNRYSMFNSSGTTLYRPNGALGWGFIYPSLRSYDGSTVLMQNGIYGENDTFRYAYLGGTSHNSLHPIRYTNDRIWFGAPAGTTSPDSIAPRRFRFSGSVQFDNRIYIQGLAISSTSALLPDYQPDITFSTGAGTYTNVIVLRSNGNNDTAGMRTTGIMFKASSESTGAESNKMAAILLQSNIAYSNSPDLNFYTGNQKRMSIAYGGSVSVDNLAGTGTRMVVASSTGVLSTNAMPVTTETDPVYTAAEPSILRYRSAITSSSNLNSFTSTGIYNGTSAVTATLSNCPFPSGEIQLSVTTSGNYIRQMITNVGSTFTNQIYTRTSVNGGTNWSSWQRLIRGGDSVSLLTNDAGYITQNIANANLSIATSTNRTLTIGLGSTFSIIGNSMIRMSGGGGNPQLELIAPNDAVFISGDNPDSFGVSMRTTNLTTNRDVDWQDTSGTVAFLHDIHPTGLVKVDDDYTVKPEELTVVCFGATTFQLTLPDPAAFTNRNLIISMQMAIASGEQVNLSEDVYFYDRSDGTTPISINSIPASEYGKYYRLQSDGTVWWLINPEP